jgi:heme/copper-type cytochrome/quinol oxidase subunit 2
LELAIKFSAPILAAVLACFALGARADDIPEFSLVIKDHVYQPGELKVPADKKFKIRITNEDATPEEFESTDFSRESVVLPKRSIVVFVGPLRAGTYGFFGDFHRDTARGRLIVE